MSPDAGNVAYLLQLAAGGLAAGALYALVALAIVIVYKTTLRINLAQGELATLGAFVVLSLTSAGLPVWVAIILALAVSFAAGAVLERTLIRKLEARGLFPVILGTLALFLIVNATMAIVWGTEPRGRLTPFPAGVDDKIDLLTGPPLFYLTYGMLGTFAVLAALMLGTWWLLNRTKFGLGYRAVTSNRDAAALLGIPIGRMFMLGWGAAAAVGTLTGVLVSQSLGTLDFNLMGPILIFGLAAATLGGFDSVAGACVGGLALGLLTAMVPGLFTVIEGDLSLLVALAVILVVLLLRPQGLFGSKRVERV